MLCYYPYAIGSLFRPGEGEICDVRAGRYDEVELNIPNENLRYIEAHRTPGFQTRDECAGQAGREITNNKGLKGKGKNMTGRVPG